MKEYLRLSRIYNAEIMSIILILSYILAANLSNENIDIIIVIILFFAGVFAHIWGAYNNDRMDYNVDKKADYCSHKPLVAGLIKIEPAKKIEYIFLFSFIALVLFSSMISGINNNNKIFQTRSIFTVFYLTCAILLAYLYNRYNKSSMFINIIGQMYAGFVVLTGMSMVISFNYILFLSAILLGLNGVYLNIIEADLKDIPGDIVNVPKTLGIRFVGVKAEGKTWFYILNEVIKTVMFTLILYILFLESASIIIVVIAILLFLFNLIIRQYFFKNLSLDREKMKKYIAAQELSSILLISTIYMVVKIWLPLIVIFFVITWLMIWNKLLWNTYIRPQV